MLLIAGLGLAAISVAAGVTTINFLGTGLSAATITTALAAIGSLVDGGMVAGIIIIAISGVVVGKLCF